MYKPHLPIPHLPIPHLPRHPVVYLDLSLIRQPPLAIIITIHIIRHFTTMTEHDAPTCQRTTCYSPLLVSSNHGNLSALVFDAS